MDPQEFGPVVGCCDLPLSRIVSHLVASLLAFYISTIFLFYHYLALPIFSACWSPDSDQVLCAVDRQLMIRSLQGGAKPTQWKAHDGLILSVDWHAASGLIISGGEDRQYKVT